MQNFVSPSGHCRVFAWSVTGTQAQECHGDAIIHEFRRRYPDAYDRNLPTTGPPSSRVLNYLACLREEPESDEGSSADEGVPEKGAGWTGRGEPMMVGVGYTAREFCDGQSLASPREVAYRTASVSRV